MASQVFTAVLGTSPPISAAASFTVTAGASAYDQQILTRSGLVGYWAMSSPTATEADLTGRGHPGTYHAGQPAAAVMPNGDQAAGFNGSSQYMSIASPADNSFSVPATGQFTWEAWIRPDVLVFPHNTSSYVDWMGKGQNYSPTCEWEARIYNGNTTLANRSSRLSAYVFNPTAGLGSGADWQPNDNNQIAAGQWYHVAGEYQTLTQPPGCNGPQTGGVNIWVNAVLWDMAKHLQTGCMSQYGIVPVANNSPVNVGTMAFDSWFAGGIGKVAFYNRLLTQAEISADYTAMTAKTPAGTCNYNNTGYCVLS